MKKFLKLNLMNKINEKIIKVYNDKIKNINYSNKFEQSYIYNRKNLKKNALTKIRIQMLLKADLNINVQNLYSLTSYISDKIISWNKIESVLSFLTDCKGTSKCVVF